MEGPQRSALTLIRLSTATEGNENKNNFHKTENEYREDPLKRHTQNNLEKLHLHTSTKDKNLRNR